MRIALTLFLVMISNSQINMILINILSMVSLVIIEFIFPVYAYNKYFGSYVSTSDVILYIREGNYSLFMPNNWSQWMWLSDIFHFL
jgi:hypothetical protein